MSTFPSLLPLRLPPQADLRRALEGALLEHGAGAAFVVSGIGSLVDPVLRFADAAAGVTLPGSFEILTLSGSLSANGAHLHMSVSDAAGRVFGGHVVYGNTVRTTAEVLLMLVPGWELGRAPDPLTGYDELVTRRL
jgi:predicted DNA-binding protein with PD1-like motif